MPDSSINHYEKRDYYLEKLMPYVRNRALAFAKSMKWEHDDIRTDDVIQCIVIRLLLYIDRCDFTVAKPHYLSYIRHHVSGAIQDFQRREYLVSGLTRNTDCTYIFRQLYDHKSIDIETSVDNSVFSLLNLIRFIDPAYARFEKEHDRKCLHERLLAVDTLTRNEKVVLTAVLNNRCANSAMKILNVNESRCSQLLKAVTIKLKDQVKKGKIKIR